MSLPDDVISLVRDEAYLDLCRNALKDALERLVAEKQQVSETRPPFGILASQEAARGVRVLDADRPRHRDGDRGAARASLRRSRTG
jgi:hypothetical protein